MKDILDYNNIDLRVFQIQYENIQGISYCLNSRIAHRKPIVSKKVIRTITSTSNIILIPLPILLDIQLLLKTHKF